MSATASADLEIPDITQLLAKRHARTARAPSLPINSSLPRCVPGIRQEQLSRLDFRTELRTWRKGIMKVVMMGESLEASHDNHPPPCHRLRYCVHDGCVRGAARRPFLAA